MKVIDFSIKVDSLAVDLGSSVERPIDLHEYSTVVISITVEKKCELKILIGDYTIYDVTEIVNGDFVIYKTSPLQIFKNFIGLTHIDVYAGDTLIVSSSPVNVFASKANYERALAFIRSLSKEADVSSICFSPTKVGSDFVNRKNNISAKVAAGLKAIENIIENRMRFKNDPCKKTSLNREIRVFNKNQAIDDNLIASISSDLSCLQPTIAEHADIKYHGRHYAIDKIDCPILRVDSDVYENRVIVSFLFDFISFLRSLNEKITPSAISKESISLDGREYISLDRILRDSGIFFDVLSPKISSGLEKSSRLIEFFSKYIPCSINTFEKNDLRVTQNVLSKPHYFSLFALIRSYRAIGEPTWKGDFELFGLRNMAKIYEIYCLVSLVGSFKQLGFKISQASYIDGGYIDRVEKVRPINEPHNYYRLERDGECTIELFYDINSELIHNVGLFGTYGYPVDLVHRNKLTWRPDFFIRISRGDYTETHVLDAKYSNANSVDRDRLNEVALKYGVQMGVSSGSEIIQANTVVVIFSGEDRAFQSFGKNFDIVSRMPYRISASSKMLFKTVICGSIGLYSTNRIELESYLKAIVEYRNT